jgi:carbamoyltransferase
MAGGVALNCVANGKILEQGIFKEIFIQPAAGDAGGGLGAALSAWYEYNNNPRTPAKDLTGSIKGSYLGPEYSRDEILNSLTEQNAKYEELNDTTISTRVADVLADGAVVGYFQGRMEFGPRALGARSIIGDPRNSKMQSTMNLKIKYRESFRPFAPAVLAEKVKDYFEINSPSPYMLIVAPVNKEHRITMTAEQENLFGIEKLNVPRSTLPAITHVDYSARIQTVHESTNPKFYRLLKAFDAKTKCAVLVNTSFNVRGEPIVNTPEDAYRCFMRTEMDYLVLENFLLSKKDQPVWEKDESWKEEFELD